MGFGVVAGSVALQKASGNGNGLVVVKFVYVFRMAVDNPGRNDMDYAGVVSFRVYLSPAVSLEFR